MILLEHASSAVNWEISFAPVSGGNRAAFWEKSSRLQFGGLIALLLKDGILAQK
jgi:hypothetical protein